MFTRLLATTTLVFLGLALLVGGAQAAAVYQDAPTQLTDCQDLAKFQAQLWKLMPQATSTIDATSQVPEWIGLTDCAELADFQANLWQMGAIEHATPASITQPAVHLSDCLDLANYQARLWQIH
jgi:hypothetical protein